MMRERFAAWILKGGAFAHADRAAFTDRANEAGLRTSALGRAVLVATTRAAPAHASSIVVGEIFARGSADPVTCSAAASVSRDAFATTLIDHFWGNYVAIGVAGAERFVLRAPFGDLACYWLDIGDRVVLATSVDLLRVFGAPRPLIDWTELARFLLATEFRRGTTCLTNIGDLSGGHELRVADGLVTIRSRWSPWHFIPADRHAVSRAPAAAALRAAINMVVAARTSSTRSSVLQLSGGLDSSIVAAALAESRHPFSCLNMVTDDPDGDERVYARAAAAHCGASLTEVMRDVDLITFNGSRSSRLPRPTDRQFRQPSEAAARALATAVGAGVVLDGGGGDNMFCSLQSPTPLLDRLAVEGPGAGIWRTAKDISLLAEVSVATVARRALARRLTRGARYRWALDHSFISSDAQAGAGSFLDHPWLEPPDSALPGEAAQIAMLLAASALTESPDSEDTVAFVSPLVAQPIAEAVLAAPTWLWFEDGRNRAIARRAFADGLPPAIIFRHSKGTPASFMANLVEARGEEIGRLLFDGMLARQGLLDMNAVSALLRARGPARDLGFARLLQLADAEVWARHWN